MSDTTPKDTTNPEQAKPNDNKQPTTEQPTGGSQQPVAPTDSSNEQINFNQVESLQNKNNQDKIKKESSRTQSLDVYSNLILTPYHNNFRKSFDALTDDGGGILGNMKNTGFGTQIVDILNDYRWTMQSFKNPSASSSDYSTHDVPFCYVTEWRQNISSGIMNLINSLNSTIVTVSQFAKDIQNQDYFSRVSSTINSVIGGLGDIFGVGDEAKSLASGAVGMASKGIQSVAGWFGSVTENAKNVTVQGAKAIADTYDSVLGHITNPASNSVFLKPYSLLYGMEETGKKYSFPMVNEPPKFNMGTNSFGDGNNDDSVSNIHKAFSSFVKLGHMIPTFRRDLLEISNLIKGGSGSKVYDAISVEKAKYFNFPTNTNSYTVSFPLINTVAKDEWKKNYTFILLFILRNMIFRKDSTSYYPPLIYDLIIPGTIREPYCYVQQVNVQPLGMMRALSWNAQIFNTLVNKKLSSIMTVFVPEVWMVTITFTSLLAPSANMVISSLTDLSISTKQK